MDRPPRDPSQPILTLPMFMRTALVILLMVLGAFAIFLWLQNRDPGAVDQARTAVVNTVVMVQIFYLLNCRSLTRPLWTLGFFSNPWLIVGIVTMLVAQLLFTYAPVMNRLFHSAPLAWEQWLAIVATGLAVYLAVGFEKWLRFGGSRRGRVPR
jgi:cation-transporting P-type ATPase F